VLTKYSDIHVNYIVIIPHNGDDIQSIAVKEQRQMLQNAEELRTPKIPEKLQPPSCGAEVS